MDASTLRFLRSVGGGPGGANHSGVCDGGEGWSYGTYGDGLLRSSMSSSDI